MRELLDSRGIDHSKAVEKADFRELIARSAPPASESIFAREPQMKKSIDLKDLALWAKIMLSNDDYEAEEVVEEDDRQEEFGEEIYNDGDNRHARIWAVRAGWRILSGNDAFDRERLEELVRVFARMSRDTLSGTQQFMSILVYVLAPFVHDELRAKRSGETFEASIAHKAFPMRVFCDLFADTTRSLVLAIDRAVEFAPIANGLTPALDILYQKFAQDVLVSGGRAMLPLNQKLSGTISNPFRALPILKEVWSGMDEVLEASVTCFFAWFDTDASEQLEPAELAEVLTFGLLWPLQTLRALLVNLKEVSAAAGERDEYIPIVVSAEQVKESFDHNWPCDDGMALDELVVRVPLGSIGDAFMLTLRALDKLIDHTDKQLKLAPRMLFEALHRCVFKKLDLDRDEHPGLDAEHLLGVPEMFLGDDGPDVISLVSIAYDAMLLAPDEKDGTVEASKGPYPEDYRFGGVQPLTRARLAALGGLPCELVALAYDTFVRFLASALPCALDPLLVVLLSRALDVSADDQDGNDTGGVRSREDVLRAQAEAVLSEIMPIAMHRECSAKIAAAFVKLRLDFVKLLTPWWERTLDAVHTLARDTDSGELNLESAFGLAGKVKEDPMEIGMLALFHVFATGKGDGSSSGGNEGGDEDRDGDGGGGDSGDGDGGDGDGGDGDGGDDGSDSKLLVEADVKQIFELFHDLLADVLGPFLGDGLLKSLEAYGELFIPLLKIYTEGEGLETAQAEGKDRVATSISMSAIVRCGEVLNAALARIFALGASELNGLGSALFGVVTRELLRSDARAIEPGAIMQLSATVMGIVRGGTGGEGDGDEDDGASVPAQIRVGFALVAALSRRTGQQSAQSTNEPVAPSMALRADDIKRLIRIALSIADEVAGVGISLGIEAAHVGVPAVYEWLVAEAACKELEEPARVWNALPQTLVEASIERMVDLLAEGHSALRTTIAPHWALQRARERDELVSGDIALFIPPHGGPAREVVIEARLSESLGAYRARLSAFQRYADAELARCGLREFASIALNDVPTNGWHRELQSTAAADLSSSVVVYITPTGVRLNCIGDVERYLSLTTTPSVDAHTASGEQKTVLAASDFDFDATATPATVGAAVAATDPNAPPPAQQTPTAKGSGMESPLMPPPPPTLSSQASTPGRKAADLAAHGAPLDWSSIEASLRSQWAKLPPLERQRHEDLAIMLARSQVRALTSLQPPLPARIARSSLTLVPSNESTDVSVTEGIFERLIEATWRIVVGFDELKSPEQVMERVGQLTAAFGQLARDPTSVLQPPGAGGGGGGEDDEDGEGGKPPQQLDELGYVKGSPPQLAHLLLREVLRAIGNDEEAHGPQPSATPEALAAVPAALLRTAVAIPLAVLRALEGELRAAAAPVAASQCLVVTTHTGVPLLRRDSFDGFYSESSDTREWLGFDATLLYDAKTERQGVAFYRLRDGRGWVADRLPPPDGTLPETVAEQPLVLEPAPQRARAAIAELPEDLVEMITEALEIDETHSSFNFVSKLPSHLSKAAGVLRAIRRLHGDIEVALGTRLPHLFPALFAVFDHDRDGRVSPDDIFGTVREAMGMPNDDSGGDPEGNEDGGDGEGEHAESGPPFMRTAFALAARALAAERKHTCDADGSIDAHGVANLVALVAHSGAAVIDALVDVTTTLVDTPLAVALLDVALSKIFEDSGDAAAIVDALPRASLLQAARGFLRRSLALYRAAGGAVAPLWAAHRANEYGYVLDGGADDFDNSDGQAAATSARGAEGPARGPDELLPGDEVEVRSDSDSGTNVRWRPAVVKERVRDGYTIEFMDGGRGHDGDEGDAKSAKMAEFFESALDHGAAEGGAEDSAENGADGGSGRHLNRQSSQMSSHVLPVVERGVERGRLRLRSATAATVQRFAHALFRFATQRDLVCADDIDKVIKRGMGLMKLASQDPSKWELDLKFDLVEVLLFTFATDRRAGSWREFGHGLRDGAAASQTSKKNKPKALQRPRETPARHATVTYFVVLEAPIPHATRHLSLPQALQRLEKLATLAGAGCSIVDASAAMRATFIALVRSVLLPLRALADACANRQQLSFLKATRDDVPVFSAPFDIASVVDAPHHDNSASDAASRGGAAATNAVATLMFGTVLEYVVLLFCLFSPAQRERESPTGQLVKTY